MSRELDPWMNVYLPQKINTGPWINAYSLYHLRELPVGLNFVLPICSLDTPFEEIMTDGRLYLPPLFREAMPGGLRHAIIDRILECFPKYGDRHGNSRQVEIVDYSAESLGQHESPSILAFSVDTAVEEHGPHLPLGTDTIQSYGVLRELAVNFNQLKIARPLEYGQLTWGLPFGFSVDLTAELLAQYVTGYVNALLEYRNPQAIYVVDVHGSITHREAIVDGLNASHCNHWAFRWLHEPLAEFASARGDQHAGGVETALVEHISNNLIDRNWFPRREAEMVEGAMTLEKAVELTPNVFAFRQYVEANLSNGIVGNIRNYHTLNAQLMFDRMLSVATSDVHALLAGTVKCNDAGKRLW